MFSVLRCSSFQIFTGNPHSKIKKRVPLVGIQQYFFPLKALKYKKTKSKDPNFGGKSHGFSIVQLKVVEARKRVRNENCDHDVIKWNIKPKFTQQTLSLFLSLSLHGKS